MGRFVQPRHFQLYKEFVEGIRSDLGRNITLYLPGDKRDCPNCLFDPINKKSTNVYSPKSPFPTDINGGASQFFRGGVCPVCSGTGQVQSGQDSIIVNALIRWLKEEKQYKWIQGVHDVNDYRVKADIKFFENFKNARVVEIDGVPCEVTNIRKRGLGTLIQVEVILKKSEWPPGFKQDVTKY